MIALLNELLNAEKNNIFKEHSDIKIYRLKDFNEVSNVSNVNNVNNMDELNIDRNINFSDLVNMFETVLKKIPEPKPNKESNELNENKNAGFSDLHDIIKELTEVISEEHNEESDDLKINNKNNQNDIYISPDLINNIKNKIKDNIKNEFDNINKSTVKPEKSESIADKLDNEFFKPLFNGMKQYEIFKLQHKMNADICGESWSMSDKCLRTGKKMNWDLCIKMETAEAIDSLNWKHWKDVSNDNIDIDNLKIELVDIYHFIVSKLISDVKPYKINKSILHNLFILIDTNFIINKSNEIINKNGTSRKNLSYLDSLELLLNSKDSSEIVKSFFVILRIMYLFKDFDFNQLYKLYIGKNALNKIRQDNGYKDGTYKKIWGKFEDNKVLTSLLENMKDEDVTFEYLVKTLQSSYDVLNVQS